MILCKQFFSRLVWLAFFVPTIALASSDAHGDAGGIGWSFFFKIVNFTILLWLLARVAKKNLPAVLSKRQETVARLLEQAKQHEEKAHALLKEYNAKLNGLGDEIESMLNKARKDAQQEKQRIIAEANDEAKHILNSAKRSAKNLEEQTLLKLRRLFADETVAMAEVKARKQLLTDNAASKQQQDSIVSSFLNEVQSIERR